MSIDRLRRLGALLGAAFNGSLVQSADRKAKESLDRLNDVIEERLSCDLTEAVKSVAKEL